MSNSYFKILSIEEAGSTEPISLAEFKEHAHISYTDEDVYIPKLIKRVRKKFEEAIWQSIVEKTVRVKLYCDDHGGFPTWWPMGFNWIYNNYSLPYIDLPYGPLLNEEEISSITDLSGNDLDSGSYVIRGSSILTYNTESILEYDTGMETVPDDIKQALLELTAWFFVNRGDQSGQSAANKTRELAAPFTKQTMIL